MEYIIGQDGKGLFLIDEADADIVVASSPLIVGNDIMAKLARPLIELKSIQDYLARQGATDPKARQDYEMRLQNLRSRMQPLLSVHWERNPLRLEQVTQDQIKKAYSNKDEGFLLSLSYGLLR